MTTLDQIRIEIERLTERRRELLRALGQGHDATLVAEHHELEERLARLWDLQRAERARVRFGERDEIIRRARTEDRLDRAA